MEIKGADAEEIRDRVIRAVQQVLGHQELAVHVTFAPTDSNEVQILATSGDWRCIFTVPTHESTEDMIGRIHKALLATRPSGGSEPDQHG